MIEKITTTTDQARQISKEEFENWWEICGSAIRRLPDHDYEEHAKRLAFIAWEHSRIKTFYDIIRDK